MASRSLQDSMTAPRQIADFDDPSFDPVATFEKVAARAEIEDPYPELHRLALRGAVQPGDVREQLGLAPYEVWGGVPSYMVFGYEAVTSIYLDTAHVSNDIMNRVYAGSFGASINGMDGPEHLRYRALFQQAFTPRTIAQWSAHLVPRVVNRLIDGFVERGKAELMSEFIFHYPFDVIYSQLDLPPGDRAVFQKLSIGLMCLFMNPARAVEASRKMGDYLQALLEERREAGTNDLIGMLGRAEINGERLPDDVVVSFFRQLLNAAGDTTTSSTGSLMVGLLTHPDQLAAVVADRSLIPQAIEETLRWEGPLTVLTRQARGNAALMGVTVPAGAKLDMVQATANRDPSRYENPDVFNIFRQSKRHVAFAYGPHVCLGQHLAKMEMERALNALLDRLPNLRLDPDYPPPTVVGLNARAPRTVHVRFDA